jgi:hypothetical protein
LRLKDELAGKKIRCPKCAGVLTVPAIDDDRGSEPEVLDVLPSDSPREQFMARRRTSVRTPEPQQEEERSPPRAPTKKASRPKRKSGERRRQRGVVFEEGWFGSLNAGIVGGILMMLIAIVWFVVGLMFGILFFYPPILLVIGAIALIKGLASLE